MRYKTDLEAVQSIAKSLLYTPVHETKFSPMVVHHPFTSSAFVAIKRKGEMEMFSILENKENLHKWQDFMSKQISDTENVRSLVCLSRHHPISSQQSDQQVLPVQAELLAPSFPCW